MLLPVACGTDREVDDPEGDPQSGHFGHDGQLQGGHATVTGAATALILSSCVAIVSLFTCMLSKKIFMLALAQVQHIDTSSPFKDMHLFII